MTPFCSEAKWSYNSRGVHSESNIFNASGNVVKLWLTKLWQTARNFSSAEGTLLDTGRHFEMLASDSSFGTCAG